MPDNRFAYGIVKIDEYWNVDEIVEIVNDTLIKSEQIKILKRTENSKLDSQSKFSYIDDNSDSFSEISEIEEEEIIDYSQLSVINVTSKSKGKEICDDSMVEDNTDRPYTSNVCDFDHVSVRDSQTDSSDDENEEKVSNNSEPEKNVSNETSIPRVVVDQVFGDTENFDKVLSEKSTQYLETNTVVYPNFKCLDDVVFSN